MRLAINEIGIALAGIEEADLIEAVENNSVLQPEKNVDTTPLNVFFPPRKLRRVDHFTRMTMLAACRALISRDQETDRPELTQQTGIVISSGYGPSQTIFDFLDSIIDFGPECASPLAFSHSVHNIPAATLSLFLDCACPCTTICQTSGPLMAGLTTASCWISEGRVEQVLLGVVDEQTPLLADNTRRLLAENKPDAEELPITEGACFFLLSAAESSSAKYGHIDFQRFTPDELPEYTDSVAHAPARMLPRLERTGIKARSVLKADLPVAAGIELAALSLAGQEGCCLEQGTNATGLVRISKSGEK